MTHSTVRAREREARCAHRTPPRESLARKPIRGKTFTREFHCYRDFLSGSHSPWRRTLAFACLSGGRIFMSKNDLTSVRTPKVKTSVIATKRTKARLGPLVLLINLVARDHRLVRSPEAPKMTKQHGPAGGATLAEILFIMGYIYSLLPA